MELDAREMETYEKCPRCGSLSCMTELSSDDRKTKCSSCGYEGNISVFREHHSIETPQTPKIPIDMFGKKGFKNPEDASYKETLLKRLDIRL